MMSPNRGQSASDGPGHVFQTTHWSVVLRVGDVHTHEQAQDLTQGFFAKLLEKNQISLADPERGRFRSFLLKSLENFLRTEHRDASTRKRGGGREIISWDANLAAERYSSERADGASPTVVFERQWVAVLLECVLGTLREEFSQSGKAELFDQLEPHVWGYDTSTPYPRIAEALNMSAVSVRVTVHRLRRRFYDLLRAQIAQTVERADDVEDELRYLLRLWSG